MDSNQQNINRIVEVISKKSAGVIIVPANSSADTVASATSLYLALIKLGKTISLASSTSIKFDFAAADKFQNALTTSGDNLVISFPYSDGSIDKVDYNIQNNNFNLIVTPRAGYSKLNPDQVKYSYAGGNIDFIIVIDATTLANLGTIYNDNQIKFQGRELINIDRHLTNSFFGSINFVDKSVSSTSELIMKLIQALGVEIDKDIASNLYGGLAAATNNFSSYSVTAETFELAAQLLKLGAVKKAFRQPIIRTPSFSQKPISMIEKEPIPNQGNQPQDWLKPKIFQNSGGLV